MLQIENLVVGYGPIIALHGISLHVDSQEIVALIGSNGAGKSTLLNTISGLLKPVSGSISFNNLDLLSYKPNEIVQQGICQVPEGRRIFYSMSVMENLEMGAVLPQNRATLKPNLEKVFELFPRLKERRTQQGGTLSGGEQQMLAIGRALMGNPKLLLLDEPSLGLAPVIVDEVYRVVREIRNSGTSILLVEQNAYQALSVADRGYVVETGNLTLQDTASNLLDSDLIKQAYLGE